MAKPGKTVAMRQLDGLGIAYTEHRQERATYDAEAAARERHLSLDQVVKSLLVKQPNGRFCLALVQGSRKLSLHKLGTVLGVKGLAMAEPKDVATVTGYEPGSVAPLGLRRRLPIVVDVGVTEQPLVSISGGRHDLGLTLASADLVRATNATVADISQ